MNDEIIIEFPKFITHVPKNKTDFIKIGYNTIHSSPHFMTRAALVAAMHRYLEKNIPENLKIEGVIEIYLTIYAPINFGDVKMVTDKTNNKKTIRWNPAKKDYIPRWDLSNLAFAWLKSMDDVLVKKGVFIDDNVGIIRRGIYQYQEVEELENRKLVYTIKPYRNELC